MLTIPQKPGLEIPTPPGQLSQCTSILNATLLRSKQELSSVCTKMDASVPTMAQGAIFDGTWVPPASKPETQIYMYIWTLHAFCCHL